MAFRLAGALDRQCHHPLGRRARCISSHASESMCTNNFTSEFVLGVSPLDCRDCASENKMNRLLPIAAAATLQAALCLAPAGASAAIDLAPAHGFAPHQLVVKLSGTRAARTLTLPRHVGVRAAAAAFRDRPNVAYVAPNYVATASATKSEATTDLPNDPGTIALPIGPPGGWVAKQWNFLPWQGAAEPLLPVSPGGIDAVGAWRHLAAAGHPGAEGITIAVLDTGIAYRTKSPRFLRSPDFTASQFVPGYDFVENDRIPLDENGHGT